MIVFKPSKFPLECEPRLNPDEENIGFSCIFNTKTKNSHGFIVPTSQIIETGKYIGSNAFDKKVIVKEKTITRHGSILNPVKNGYLEGNVSLSVSNIPSKPGNLKRDYEKIRVGITLVLNTPYIDKIVSGTTPTIKDPNDITIIDNVIVGHPGKAYIFLNEKNSPYRTYKINTELNSRFSNSIYSATFTEIEPQYNLYAKTMPDNNQNTILHLAIWDNHTDYALQLIKKGDENINAQNKFGATPLHLAVAKRNLVIVKNLIDAGANPDMADKYEATPLSDAIKNGFTELYDLLKSKNN